MKIHKLLLTMYLLFIVILSSCKQNEESPQIQLRASLLSSGGGVISASVYPENCETGNIVTGAVVLVYNSANEVTELPFDNDSQCYTETLSDTLTNDTYTVVVDSSLCDEMTMTVPHVQLQEKPVVSVFEDSDGNSVLEGTDVDSTLPLQIAWNSLGDDVVYKVTVQSSLSTVFIKSTQTANVVVPASTLEEGGSYYLSITAQYIQGDPYFKTESYYSASSIKSAGVSFNVQ